MQPPTSVELTLTRLVCDLYTQVMEAEQRIRDLVAENERLVREAGEE